MFDLENLEGHKISKDLSSYTSLIYGVPKVGKSTFAHNMFGKDCLFLAFEKGYRALAEVFAVDITKWSDLYQINKELKKEAVKNKFKVLVIDTLDLFDKMAKEFIIENNSLDDMSGMPFGKAYELKDNLIFDMLRAWENMGYRLMFISHSKEVSVTINEVETTKYQPSVDKRTLGIVSKMVDIIGFAYLQRNEETGEEDRALFLRESLRVQAGTRFKYMPKSVPLNVASFTKALEEAIEKEENENPNFMTDKREENVVRIELDFDKIMSEIVKLVKEEFAPNGQMDKVTKIIENHMGLGAKVTEATPNQVQVCDIILTELLELKETLKK